MQPLTKDDRTWAMLAHLSGLAGYVVPFGNIFGPLIVWLLKKDQSWFIDDQGKEAVNFQISLTIYVILAIISIIIAVGIFLIPLVAVAGLIFMIVAAIKSNEGVTYRYPLTLRLIK
jgi:uncharacterized Tic20 family protein